MNVAALSQGYAGSEVVVCELWFGLEKRPINNRIGKSSRALNSWLLPFQITTEAHSQVVISAIAQITCLIIPCPEKLFSPGKKLWVNTLFLCPWISFPAPTVSQLPGLNFLLKLLKHCTSVQQGVISFTTAQKSYDTFVFALPRKLWKKFEQSQRNCKIGIKECSVKLPCAILQLSRTEFRLDLIFEVTFAQVNSQTSSAKTDLVVELPNV